MVGLRTPPTTVGVVMTVRTPPLPKSPPICAPPDIDMINVAANGLAEPGATPAAALVFIANGS